MKKIRLKKLLANLQKTSVSEEVEAFLNEVAVKRRPYLDEEEIAEGIYNVWLPIKKLGLELEFKSESIFTSFDEENVSQSLLILTSYIFYSEAEGIRQYPYKLPYKLTFADTREEVRKKLQHHDAFFKPYIRDVWQFRNHTLTVSYNQNNAVEDVTYMLTSPYIKEEEKNKDIKSAIHLFGEDIQSSKLADVFSFFDYKDFLGEQEIVTPRFIAKEFGFGIDFSNAAIFDNLEKTGTIFSEIVFYRKGYLDFSYGYEGVLPYELSFDDSPTEFIAKIDTKAVSQYELEEKMEGHAIWDFSDFSMKIVYSTLMNNIARIHIYPSWYWNEEVRLEWSVESELYLT